MLGLALILVGVILALVGYIWVVVLAFQEHVGWGIGCLLCGLVQLIFAIQNWDEAGKPFLFMIGGNVLAAIGSALLDQNGAAV